ncbi:MAG: methyltransferase domain-containing protein [Deltaproteobacteria bacterium]|nr:methyltransferase domain-containing protein [Deltaproteobacteria bacterium]
MNTPITSDREDAPCPDEQCIALTGSYRLFQKRRGHRYSVDDMLVAHLAATRVGASPPEHVLDLGCGLGSVLLITAWAFPDATFIGLERLGEHVAFARRNIDLNGCQHRARVVSGDLRDQALLETLGTFDLVTGSPPYFDPARGTLCQDPARAAAHFELAGGIEDYAAAASLVLRPRGRFVGCANAEPAGRLENAIDGAGLSMIYTQQVVPRTGKPPFLTRFVATQKTNAPKEEGPILVLRDAEGRRTPEHRKIRAWTGVGPR